MNLNSYSFDDMIDIIPTLVLSGVKKPNLFVRAYKKNNQELLKSIALNLCVNKGSLIKYCGGQTFVHKTLFININRGLSLKFDRRANKVLVGLLNLGRPKDRLLKNHPLTKELVEKQLTNQLEEYTITPIESSLKVTASIILKAHQLLSCDFLANSEIVLSDNFSTLFD